MIQIMPLKKSDAEFVFLTENELFSDPWSQKSIEDFLSSAYGKGFLLFWDSAPACYLLFSEIASEAEILRIGCQKKFQKRGFAENIMEHLFSALQKNKANKIFLEVRSQNLPAIRLYEKTGFEKIGKRQGYYQNPADDALLYQKNLL